MRTKSQLCAEDSHFRTNKSPLEYYCWKQALLPAERAELLYATYEDALSLDAEQIDEELKAYYVDQD